MAGWAQLVVTDRLEGSIELVGVLGRDLCQENSDLLGRNSV